MLASAAWISTASPRSAASDITAGSPIAGRDKDLLYLDNATEYQMADRDVLLDRLKTVEIDAALRDQARGVILRRFK